MDVVSGCEVRNRKRVSRASNARKETIRIKHLVISIVKYLYTVDCTWDTVVGWDFFFFNKRF